MKQINDLIKAHPEKNYTTAELALAAGVSTAKLKNDVRKVFRQGLHQYILQTKIDYALQLLENEKHSLPEIASLTGFTNTPELIKAVKKHYRHKAPKPKL